MYNINRDSGFAERQSWMQVDDASVVALTGNEGNSTDSKDRRFATLTYNVNPNPVNISGDVVVDSVGIDDSGMVGVTDGQLNVYQKEIVIDKTFSRVIQEDLSGNTYIAQAPVGTSTSTNGWRAQKIDQNGSRSWYDSGNFTAPANNLSGLIYAY